MILILKNQTANNISYLGGLVTVPANGSYTATASTIFALARDPQLNSDVTDSDGDIVVSDGVTDYSMKDGPVYLNQIASSLGGAVVGYAGSAAPSYQITVGGKDSSGNSQPARMNQFGDLSINFRNSAARITGNSTTTVKSGAGTLHGLLIGNNNTGGTVTIYDNTSATGTPKFVLQLGSPSGGLLSTSGLVSPAFLGPLGFEFSTGLTIVTSGSLSNDITAIYQ